MFLRVLVKSGRNLIKNIVHQPIIDFTEIDEALILAEKFLNEKEYAPLKPVPFKIASPAQVSPNAVIPQSTEEKPRSTPSRSKKPLVNKNINASSSITQDEVLQIMALGQFERSIITLPFVPPDQRHAYRTNDIKADGNCFFRYYPLCLALLFKHLF